VFPSKVITLMSSARAVVASVSPGSEVARVLREADAGVLVAPEDPGALMNAVIALRDDPARRSSLGSKGRMFAERFWEKQRTLSVLEAHLLEIAANGKSRSKQLVTESEESPR
jgi:colanic acid biosynthesis glycosyl transferase WcaI